VSAFTVYKDEYNNELDQPEWLAGMLGPVLKPLRRFAAIFHLPNFFFKDNIFTVNELSSLFHLPDGLYNRSPVIKWMNYKVLSAPDNLPKLKEETDKVITGVIADEYLDGDVSKIFHGSKDPAVVTKEETVTKRVEVTGK